MPTQNYKALLDEACRVSCDVVIVAALDRLAGKLSDVATGFEMTETNTVMRLIALTAAASCSPVCCGLRYTIMAKECYGCAFRRSKGNCSNGRTISRKEIQVRRFRASQPWGCVPQEGRGVGDPARGCRAKG